MAKNYVNEGDVIQHTNGGSAISSGDVVIIGETIGIALVDIANGETGSVKIKGRFTVSKVSTAVIAQGESVIWDSSVSAFEDNQHTPATGDVSGGAIAAAAAGNGDTTVDIILNGLPGTVA